MAEPEWENLEDSDAVTPTGQHPRFPPEAYCMSRYICYIFYVSCCLGKRFSMH